MKEKEKNIIDKFSTSKITALNFAAIKAAPAAIVTVMVISVSYFTDFIISGKAEIGIGELSAFSRLLYECGNLLSKLIPPIISAGIAFILEGSRGLYPGVLGGFLAGSGGNFAGAVSNATGVSGIYGCILAGFAAGYSAKIMRKILKKRSTSENAKKEILISVTSILFTLFFMLAVNSFAGYINHFASGLAGLFSNINGLLLSALLGLFMTLDFGGPLYLAGYTFAVASLSTGDGRYMAAVVAAGAVPSITMGLYSLIYKEQTQRYEKITGIAGILGGLLGLSHCAVIFYAKKTVKFVPACIAGGLCASVLSYTLSCSCYLPAGGILGFEEADKLLFFLTSLCFASFLSTFLLSILSREKSDDVNNEQENSAKSKIEFSAET